MKQLVQSVKSGELELAEVPVPSVGSTQVLVATTRSAVSPGTERAVRSLASASLLGKARARPDLVRQVLSKAKSEGIASTAKAVRAKLDDYMPLGYSAVGQVVEVGPHVDRIRPGMRVATAGSGHGEYQLVAGLLAAPVPDNVSDANAAMATVASIALHGLRLAELGPGSRVGVIGLGLVGQITCRLARASGYLAYGIDVRDFVIDICQTAGFPAEADSGADTTRRVRDWARGQGLDAVLITAATPSSDPIRRSTELVRDRAPIVVVGDVGMELERRPLYEHELTVKVARSYGPGRYERSYEDWAVDYPIGHVRWTEGRNLEAVLDLMAAGLLDLSDLVTHEYSFEKAEEAYQQIESATDSMGIQFLYPNHTEVDRSPVQVNAPKRRRRQVTDQRRIGLLGAGGFAKGTLVPAIEAAEFGRVEAVCSATGISAKFLAERHGIDLVYADAEQLLNNDDLNTIIVATPHSTHADLVLAALEAGKDVFCEKPLCLTLPELDRIEQAATEHGGYLQVGYNRRHSPSVQAALELTSGSGPLVVSYRVNAGELPNEHWYSDRREGGRLIGEVCHFIDVICALAGDVAPLKLDAFGSGVGPAELDQDIVVSLSFPSGVVGTIAYAGHGHGAMPKEQIEIIGRGHSIVIEDFSKMIVDGETRKNLAGKGHAAQFAAFEERSRNASPALGILATRLTLEAASRLGQGAGNQ